MKGFEQVVLLVKSYNMDVNLQIFKRSINSSTFFESITKKPTVLMNDLF